MRQTLTRYWKYDMFLQKIHRVGFNFVKLQNFYYYFEIFFTCYRPSHLKIRNFFIKRLWRKNTFRLDGISNYKFINNRNIFMNKTLLFFCNISSRTEMFPGNPQTFITKNLQFRNEKKIARFSYSFFIYKKQFLAHNFFKLSLLFLNGQKRKNEFAVNKMFNKLVQTKNWLLNWKKQFRLLNKKNIKKPTLKKINNFIRKREPENQINFLSTFSNEQTNEILKESTLWSFDTQMLLKSSITSLQQHIFSPSKKRLRWWKLTKKINYKYSKLNKVFLFFLSTKLKTKFYSITTTKLLYKIKTKKNKNKKIKNFFFWKKMLKIKFFREKKTSFTIKNRKKIYITKTKKDIFIFRNLQNTDIPVFWYIQFLNKFMVYEYKYFFNKNITNLPNQIKFFFQQEFSFPRSFYLLQIINKKMRIMTNFLKNNKKFYNNFLNIMPAVQTFTQISLLSKQLAIELARTKKHWRIIRGMELIFLQAFIQLRKEPIEGKGGFLGLRIVINGRPNKISRTKKVVFSLGKIKKGNFVRFNVFQTFAPSKAQIGSFGISVSAATH